MDRVILLYIVGSVNEQFELVGMRPHVLIFENPPSFNELVARVRVAASSHRAHRGGEGSKARLQISAPDESEDEIVEEETDEDVDVYLNTTMFAVRKC
jgi:hypothetical protein